jgi:peptidoglycan/LPS O-acetylase OafA/YrhL
MPKLLRVQVARAVAANLVVLSHCFLVQNKYVPGGWLPEFLHYGLSGVDIFFVLSGFIIVVSGATMQPVEFLWRRAGRIYPTYWLVSIVWLTLILTLPSVINTQPPPSETLWRSFLLIPEYRTPLLDVGWTLTYEVYFYAVFALILAVRLPIHLGLLAWAVALVALRLFAGDAVASSPVASTYTGALVAEFVMGALVGLAYQRSISAGANAAGAIGIAALVISIVLVGPTINLVESPDLNLLRTLLFGVPAALVLYWLAARERQGTAEPPRWLVLLGDASYSTYLTHYLFLAVLSRALHAAGVSGVWGSLMLTALGVVGANLTGVVLFLAFERPTLRALHRLRFGRGRLLLADRRPAEVAPSVPQ